MDQATWVIQVLDDSENRSIEYKNRFWLRKNVEKMKIRVCVEGCLVNMSKIEEEFEKEGTILIQEGKRVKKKSSIRPEKEALLLIKFEKKSYLVFLYSPKN